MSRSDTATPLRDRVNREAKTRDIDIDSVEHVDTESEGTTVRVLYKDAPDEADQIGFQVTKPPGPMGDQMFGEQLQNGFRELRNYLRGTDTNSGSDSDTDTASESDTEAADTPSPSGSDTGASPSPSRTDDTEADPDATSTASPGVGEINHEVTLETRLAQEDHEAMRTAMQEFADQFQAKEERINELQTQLDEMDNRVEKLENAIANIGSGLSVLTEDEDNAG